MQAARARRLGVEEAPAGATDEWEYEQAVLVDQVVLHQRPDQLATAEDDEVAFVPLLEGADKAGIERRQHLRTAPCHVPSTKRLRDDVFRHPVHRRDRL